MPMKGVLLRCLCQSGLQRAYRSQALYLGGYAESVVILTAVLGLLSRYRTGGIPRAVLQSVATRTMTNSLA